MLYYTLILMRLVQTAAYIMLFFYALIKLKEPKRKRITITMIMYVVVILAYCAVAIFFGQKIAESLAVPVEIGLCLILIIICSADKWPVSLFIMFTQFNLYLGIRYLSRIFTTEDVGIVYEASNFIYRTLMYVALLFFLFKIARPFFRRVVEQLEKEWYLIAMVAGAFYVLEAVIQYYPRIYWQEADKRWYLVVSSYLLFIAVYLLLFKSIGAFLKKHETQEQGRILTLQNKMWQEQIEEQKNAVSSARRDRHDLRHHYDTLLAMLQGGKTQEAVSYLNAQTQRAENMALAGVCEHLAANAILSRWSARARDNGIKTEIDAKIPANLPMDEVALVGILANSFENAVEGCRRVPDETERFITAKIAYSVYNGAGTLHIVFENSCADNIVFENGFPKSQKRGGGTGTKSIAYTAERYNGMVEYSAENGVFKTRILLHL